LDATFTDEQEMLAETAGRVADRLGPASVHDLGSTDLARAAKELEAAGLLGLSLPVEAGGSGASAVEVAIVAEAFGRRLVPVPFIGPELALELLVLADEGSPRNWAAGETTVTLALDTSLTGIASDPGGAIGWDAAGATRAVARQRDGEAWSLMMVSLDGGQSLAGADLTRCLKTPPSGATGATTGTRIDRDQMTRWEAFALTLLCADMVGAMFGSLAMAVEHAKQRSQFGSPIGSFQAIQHLCAEQLVSTEAARAATYHSAWAVGGLTPDQALLAARTAKAYVSRHARTVTEAVLQVHGGIGQTWESLAHVYLRRALLDRATLGDESAQLAVLAGELLRGRPGHR
jgi:alkylation response protein AidB-like acyl-CoA dehydrogenase